MAAHAYQRKSSYKSKARLFEEVHPFEITKVQLLVHECYVDKETLRACETRVFIGNFKTAKETVWTVSIMPKNLQLLAQHNDAAKIFEKVGLLPYFSLPLWGIDVKRSYQLINTLTEEGTANIEDNEGAVI